MMQRIGKCILIGLSVLAISGPWLGRSATVEPPVLARLSGAEKERVAELIAGAKKEGELVGFSSNWRPDVQARMIPQFREMYGLSESDLKIKIVSTRTSAVVTKITEELRAKVYKTDFAQTAPAFWFDDLIANKELMAYNCPEYRHFSPLVADPKVAPANPPYYISAHLSCWGIVYNPKYVKRKILHWKDVLQSEYRSKFCMPDVSRSFSSVEAYIAIRSVVGRDFFDEIGKLRPIFDASQTDAINKVVSGEYPIAVIASQETGFRANEKGAGLKLVLPSEGWAMIGYPMAILAHAPHPNAAKLFMDYVHGEPCQDLFLNFGGTAVGRLGIKAKHEYPKPIYELQGAIKMDWRKVTKKDRDEAREEFRKLVRDRK